MPFHPQSSFNDHAEPRSDEWCKSLTCLLTRSAGLPAFMSLPVPRRNRGYPTEYAITADEHGGVVCWKDSLIRVAAVSTWLSRSKALKPGTFRLGCANGRQDHTAFTDARPLSILLTTQRRSLLMQDAQLSLIFDLGSLRFSRFDRQPCADGES